MSGKVRIKVCGVSNPDDVTPLIDAGVDLVGLNFVPGSPREVDLATAEAISRSLEGHVDRVAVFRNAEPADIERVLRRVDFERVQLHGDETEEEVEAVDLPVIKALRGADLVAAEEYPGIVLLLDHPSAGGGQGQTWPWSEASELIVRGYDIILAGGLDPDNVGEAIGDLGDLLPWGVDVATGVEGEGYRKDPTRIAAFIEAVRKAESEE